MNNRSAVIEFPAAGPRDQLASHRVTLVAIEEDGSLRVRTAQSSETLCDWLETAIPVALNAGDSLIALLPETAGRGVVVGRIGRYTAPDAVPHLTIESAQTLTLRCGEASVDMRADGKVMVRGDDVLLKAKGTQRIKAGSVSIN